MVDCFFESLSYGAFATMVMAIFKFLKIVNWSWWFVLAPVLFIIALLGIAVIIAFISCYIFKKR